MRRLIALLSVMTIAACGDKSVAALNEPTPISVVGAYTLKTIDGAAVPATLNQSATQKVIVTDDIITLNADNTYSQVGHYQVITGSDTVNGSTNDTGTYTAADGAVTLISAGGSSAIVTVDGNQLTATTSGSSLIFSK